MAFSRLNAPAHTFARLRIARAVVATGARLATDLPGSALVGSVSHRLDDDSGFQGFIAPPLPPDQPGLVALRLCVETTVLASLVRNTGTGWGSGSGTSSSRKSVIS